ncbi:unnamed protein product [Fraxinus pennsylvanica]|uniref:X8 domain-containing protein n=1 Tax=Fraxinus pennsylvanica TaxID=56036 RepID=A0AAD2DXB4_9LAMI|nr:unnamed protein product [Fraxinus pennsylvanica]
MWCVAKVSATDAQMQAFLDANCGSLDCGQINPGGTCFEPNTVRNHASYALDLYYRNNGVCNADIGTPAATNPCKCYGVYVINPNLWEMQISMSAMECQALDKG